MSEEEYDLIVVDGRESSLEGAKVALGRYEEVNVDFESCYEEAKVSIHQNTYDIGIFGLLIPKTPGDKEEELGVPLAQRLAKQEIPWAIMASDSGQGGEQVALETYFWSPGESREIKGASKAGPRAWDRVYEHLKNAAEVDANYKWQARIGEEMHKGGDADFFKSMLKNLKEKRPEAPEELTDAHGGKRGFPIQPDNKYDGWTGEPQIEAFL